MIIYVSELRPFTLNLLFDIFLSSSVITSNNFAMCFCPNLSATYCIFCFASTSLFDFVTFATACLSFQRTSYTDEYAPAPRKLLLLFDDGIGIIPFFKRSFSSSDPNFFVHFLNFSICTIDFFWFL